MSLGYVGTITLTSTNLTDGVIDPGNNQLYIIESTGPTMRKYSMSSLAQQGSNITTSGSPAAITLVNTLSSVIFCQSTTLNYVENATGYVTSSTGSTSVFGTTKGQRAAADTGNGVALAVGSAANKIAKATSAGVVSVLTLTGTTNFIGHCIIFKSSGRFLVGGTKGKVYEIDTSGLIQDEMEVTVDPNTGLLTDYTGNPLEPPIVSSMSYDNNLLLVSTSQSLMCYDYSTKTKLWEQPIPASNGTDQLTLCAASSGFTLFGYNVTLSGNNVGKELNFTTYAPQLGDTFFTDTTSPVFCSGFSPNTSQGFFLQGTTKIRVVNVTAQLPTSTYVMTLPAGYNNARLIILDDSLGVGQCKWVLDTYIVSGNSYRLPTGKTLIGITKMFNGIKAFWCESRVAT